MDKKCNTILQLLKNFKSHRPKFQASSAEPWTGFEPGSTVLSRCESFWKETGDKRLKNISYVAAASPKRAEASQVSLIIYAGYTKLKGLQFYAKRLWNLAPESKLVPGCTWRTKEIR